jgi:amidophosphoribosyltransferase
LGADKQVSGLKEECGVAGVILKHAESIQEAAYINYLCLNALQHRGQESGGIISFNRRNEGRILRDMGLVSHIFDDKRLNLLEGHLAVGHVRYSTTGESLLENAQPFTQLSSHFQAISLAHNGNLVNTNQLREIVLQEGNTLNTSSDSELMSCMVKQEIEKLETINPQEILSAIKKALSRAKGAFSLAISLGGKYLIAVRDPKGIRPLCLGALGTDELRTGILAVSESCALDIVDAKFIKELAPGEIVLIDEDLNIYSDSLEFSDSKLCLFELIYFARPDSRIKEVQVHSFREALGRSLARLSPPPPQADIVIGVPDSGVPAAIGFAAESGIPYANGLIKNRYIGRTFIQPTQSMRQLGIKLKLNALPGVVKGKSIILVDDSIVRGNTPRQLIKLLKLAGAKEVHMRISSPPIMWGCHYGIAMKNHELLARKMQADINAIAKEIGADSLSYLDLDEILSLTGQPTQSFCTACFNGNYPAGVADDNYVSKALSTTL